MRARKVRKKVEAHKKMRARNARKRKRRQVRHVKK